MLYMLYIYIIHVWNIWVADERKGTGVCQMEQESCKL